MRTGESETESARLVAHPAKASMSSFINCHTSITTISSYPVELVLAMNTPNMQNIG